MIKKKIDLTIERICKQCGTGFMPTKPILLCKKCSNEKARLRQMEKREKEGFEKKKPYPYSTYSNEQVARFHRIQRELREAWKMGREAVNEHYRKQLREIAENGILEWIIDRRDAETNVKQKGSGKTGRPKETKREYPSTLVMPE
jgi:hypothetical protein